MKEKIITCAAYMVGGALGSFSAMVIGKVIRKGIDVTIDPVIVSMLNRKAVKEMLAEVNGTEE